jgi:esterase/lipase superfamily enzyme
MAKTRIERIIRSVVSEFVTEASKRLGRDWRNTAFVELVPDARRRSIMFRRMLAEIPTIRSTVAGLVADRSLTPAILLDHITSDAVMLWHPGQIKKSATKAGKKVAVKKATRKGSVAKKAAVKKAAKKFVVKKAAKKSVAKKAAPRRSQPKPTTPALPLDYALGAQGPGYLGEPTTKSAHSSVRIFYATDRKPLLTQQPEAKFGAERQSDGSLTFGVCVVSIPKKHKMGNLESPSYLHLEFRPNPQKHVSLLETNTLEEAQFFDAVSQSVAKSEAKDAFIFVHGYNTTFEDAARRTGQFAFDLGFIGAPILYSWPANGRARDYFADEATVIWTAPHFERFLGMITARSGASRIHVIAHSMGNRAVCDALNLLSSMRSKNPAVVLNHLVLAAPDIDAGTFQQLALALKRVSKFVTLYASSSDRAIKLSQKLHKAPRAGALPLVIVPGVDSIDASDLGAGWLAHSYFTDNWPVLSDIHALLSSDTPAAKRFGLSEHSSEHGGYFVFRRTGS